MKILLYSDVHISKTSSIMPLNTDNSKYSFRQQLIIDTGKYLAELAKQNSVDMIINLGDTFDQHTITSYDVSTASEFFKCFKECDIPHLVIVGNHEMVNSKFNAIELLNNIENIVVISKPSSLRYTDYKTGEELEYAILPYTNYKDVISFPDGTFLFSHQDIQGSRLRGDIVLKDGLDGNVLKQKYKLVFNGHIHKPSIMGNVVNVGSIMTHSFADDNEAVPQCYIFDTQTLDLQTFKPTICPLFRKMYVDTLDELKSKLEALDSSYKYIINCDCPYIIKDDVKQYLLQSDKVLNQRLSVRVDEATIEAEKEDMILQQSNLDIVKAFREFLNTVDLKYPRDLYMTMLDTMESREVNEFV